MNRNQTQKSPKKVKLSSESAPIGVKIEKSVVIKTASAVRNKYSSMSSTKREYSLASNISITKVAIQDKSHSKTHPEEPETKILRNQSPQKVTDPKIVEKIENDLKKLEENKGGIQDSEVAVVIENVENENDVRPLERKPKGIVENKDIPQRKVTYATSPSSNNAPVTVQGKKISSPGNFKVLSPSKKEYLENLKKTIESCKAKLGMSKEGSSELKEIIAEGEEDSECGNDDKESDEESYASDSAEEYEKDKNDEKPISDQPKTNEKCDKDDGVKNKEIDITKDNVDTADKQSIVVEKDIDSKQKDRSLKEKDRDSSTVPSESQNVEKEVLVDETGLLMEVDEEPDSDQMQSCDSEKEISPSKLKEKLSSENVEHKERDKETKNVQSNLEVQDSSAGTKSPRSVR